MIERVIGVEVGSVRRIYTGWGGMGCKGGRFTFLGLTTASLTAVAAFRRITISYLMLVNYQYLTRL